MFLLALLMVANAIELTPDNYDTVTAGKTVFLKHLAPWWGHCKKMKPDWDKLMAKYADSPTVVIADIDCTAGGKPLCDAHGVRGYPTIKYGDPNALEDYKGGRTYADLEKFAAESLGPSCGPANMDLCNDDEKAEINALLELTDEEIAAKIDEGTKKMADAEATFKSEVEKLQATYEQLQKDKEATLAEVQSSGLGNLKKVKAFRATQAKDEDKDEL